MSVFLHSMIKDLNVNIQYEKKKMEFDIDIFLERYLKEIDNARQSFYKELIPMLIEKNKPLTIVETGTMWGYQGSFDTIIGDLLMNYTGGRLYTIDIDPIHIELSKSLSKEFESNIEYIIGDSIDVLMKFDKNFLRNVDMFYFDSFDIDLKNPSPSWNHHYMEFLTVLPFLNPAVIIAVDDNYIPGTDVEWVWRDNETKEITEVEIIRTGDKCIGKGTLIDKFIKTHNLMKVHENIVHVGQNNVFLYSRLI